MAHALSTVLAALSGLFRQEEGQDTFEYVIIIGVVVVAVITAVVTPIGSTLINAVVAAVSGAVMAIPGLRQA